MATPIAFVSHRKIEEKRKDKKKAQDLILNKAKQRYEREERKQKLRKERGDDKWMLPAVSEALDDKKLSKKKSKRKEKDKERKKHKKSKKRKTKEKDVSSGSNDSSEEEEEWVEAGSVSGSTDSHPSEASITHQKDHVDSLPAGQQETLQRDSWMESPFLTATYSASEIRKQREEKKQEEREKERNLHSLDNAGRSDRELNPFWKDGGTGLPEEDPNKERHKPLSHVGVADRGVGWLRKSYERVKQQAKEDGRPFEEVAAERWGSLEKIHAMLEEVEGGQHGSSRASERQVRDHGRSWRRDDDSRGRYDRRNRDDERVETRDRYRKERDTGREHEFKRDYGEQRKRGFMKPEDENGSRDGVGEKYRRVKGQFQKPNEGESVTTSRQVERKSTIGLGSLKGQFRKPGEVRNSPYASGKVSQTNTESRWRRAGYEKPKSSDPTIPEKVVEKTKKREETTETRSQRKSESSSSSSSSSEEDGDVDEEEEREEEQRLLSKDEMNQLGAKIVRAEIMGNQKMVDELKKKLEAAREAASAAGAKAEDKRKEPPQKGGASQSKERHGKEEEVVILSRTNRMGQSYPLPEEAGQRLEKGSKKRRKKKGVETHDKDGERERYFGDDDNVDLKTMVQREKMGLAEDQNAMFARAQARALKSLNEEYTLDDMFVSSANKQSDRDEVQRQRDRAIREHQRMEAALSRCPFCIDSPEMQKHLIIALGIKVYLCLPRTVSLTSGHCLIVPMQHSMACTSVDEDVFNEIQIFRKGLTKMFEDHGKDAIFIEYSSSGKTQRHMCLECIPVPNEIGETAPIYFKKAIQESETEWSQNKKLIDTRKKDIRHSVPKGFPYFSVDFGLDGGFAHVIEDSQLFPHYFGKEILGGMLDLEPRLWRNPPKENFESQRKKVIEFGSWWKPFDWTQKIDREKT